MMNRRMLIALFCAALLLLTVIPVMAQDAAPTPVTPEGFIERLLTLVFDVTYIPTAAAGVVVFLSLIHI